MFIKLLFIFFPLLINGANENLLCIAEQPLSEKDTNRTFMPSVNYDNMPTIQKDDYIKKIYNGINQVKEKNKLYFSSTEAIVNFVEHGNFIGNNILYTIVSKIRHIGKCLPYSSKSTHNNLIPEDNFIKSVLKKIEKKFFNEINNDHLLKFFNQITFFVDSENNDLKLILDIQNNETQIKKNNPQEKLFCIVDATDLEREDISFVTCETNNTHDDEKKIKQNISDLMTKNKKLGFYSTASIIAFIKLGLPDKPPKEYLKNLISMIEKHSPYNDNDQYIFNIQPGDTLIEFILEKIEKIFSNSTLSAVDFNENIEFYEEDSVKKVRLKKHAHATIETQNSLKNEEKESVPLQTRSLFKIQDEYSYRYYKPNPIYYEHVYDAGYPDKFPFVKDETKKNIQRLQDGEPIFFKNVNAIRNYVYFAIAYDDNEDNNKRKMLLDMCDTLLKEHPYNDSNYEFTSKDHKIIALLEILEKIHNKTLITDKDLKLNLERIKNQTNPIIAEENKVQIPQTKTIPTADFNPFGNSTVKLLGQKKDSVSSQNEKSIFHEINSNKDLKKAAGDTILKISITQKEDHNVPHKTCIEDFSNNNFQFSALWNEINQAIQAKEIFFQNLTAIKNYIHHSIKNPDAKKILNDFCNSVCKIEPYRNKNHTFKKNDQTIIDFLKIVQKTVQNQFTNTEKLQNSVNKILNDAQLKNSVNEQKSTNVMTGEPSSAKDKIIKNSLNATRSDSNNDNNEKSLNPEKINTQNPLKKDGQKCTPPKTNILDKNPNDLKLDYERITNPGKPINSVSQQNDITNPETTNLEENSDIKKKENPSNNKNPSLKKSSIIRYLFGLTVCAASLICLYKLFNPYILKRIYQPS